MRICAVGLRGIPDVMGGIETHCQNLYTRLARYDDQLDIIVIGRSAYCAPGAHAGVRVATLWAPRQKYLETLVHTPLALLYARLRLKPDIVHLHGVGPNLFAPLAQLLGFTVVATHHAADYERPKWGAFGRFSLKFGERLLAAFADRIICVSNGLAQTLWNKYPRSRGRTETIPNGAPPAPPLADADHSIFDRLGIKPGQYVLAVGRIEPTKGFHDLVEAFNRAAPAGKSLVIVGAVHTEHGYCQTLLAQRSDRVLFAGQQNAATLRLLYENTALFVLPSYMEGSPLVALEAMAAGAPLLLSDIPANREFNLEPHNYFRAGDVADLAAILAHNDYHTLRSKHAAAFLRENTWDRIAARHLAIFRGCAHSVVGESAMAE